MPNPASHTMSGGSSSAKNVRTGATRSVATNPTTRPRIRISRSLVSGAATSESTVNPTQVSVITAAVCD